MSGTNAFFSFSPFLRGEGRDEEPLHTLRTRGESPESPLTPTLSRKNGEREKLRPALSTPLPSDKPERQNFRQPKEPP